MTLEELFQERHPTSMKELYACYEDWRRSLPKYHFENKSSINKRPIIS
jgi:hypothetical protein